MGWRRRRAEVEVDTPTVTDHVLRLEREAQVLRLDLAEKAGTIERLEADLQRERETDKGRPEVERLLAGAATPLAQLATQTQLAGVDAASVLAIARSLLRDLTDEGIRLIGRAGDTEPYDPGRHEPLAEGELDPGQPVVVRIIGIAYQETIVRRASVERA